MGKLKASLPTIPGQALLQTQAPHSFLDKLADLAQPVEKAQTAKADPVLTMRAKFVSNADEAIKAIKSANDSGRWFKRLPEGAFVVWFRNANSVMSLNGSTHFQVANASAAVTFLEAAKVAVQNGELDDALKATQRKRPEPKPKQPKAEEAPATA